MVRGFLPTVFLICAGWFLCLCVLELKTIYANHIENCFAKLTVKFKVLDPELLREGKADTFGGGRLLGRTPNRLSATIDAAAKSESL